MPVFRRLACRFAFLCVLGASTTATAQFGTGGTTGTGGTSGGSVLAASDFFIGIQRNPGSNLTDFELARFFDKAACDCDTPVFIYVSLTASGFAKRAAVPRMGNIEFWVGPTCDNSLVRATQCLLIKSQLLASFMMFGRDTAETNARVLSTETVVGSGTADGGVPGNFGTPNPTCTLTRPQFTQKIWVLVDTNSDNNIEVTATREVLIDLEGPPPPEDVSAVGGHEALVVNWAPVDSATNTDLVGFQILCRRGADLQVFENGTFESGFQTCGAGSGIEGLDPNFACSPQLSISTNSFRVKILQNDIPYAASVVAIDRHGNASPSGLVFGTPQKSKSFYDYYREGDNQLGGDANGGYCSAASVRPLGARSLLASGAISLLALCLAARRRRRR